MKNSLLILSFIFSVMVVMSISAEDEKKRIEAKQVNIRNYEQFIEQLKHDLPVGTSIKDVEAYLLKQKISHSYVPNEGSFYVMLKKIYSAFFIFKTDLFIEIFVSEEAGVSEIKHDLIETAF